MNSFNAQDFYLWVIQHLGKKYCCVRSVDVAHYLSNSKPTVSCAVKKLIEKGLLIMESDGNLALTERGTKHMLRYCERCNFFVHLLLSAGMDPDTAEREAFSLAQAIQPDTYIALEKYLSERVL